LSDTSANPLTRALLRSGRGDAPSDDARRHAAIAIGVAGAITASTGTAGAAGGATGAAAATKWLASAALLKWAGVTIVGATLAGGVLATELAHERSRETPPQPAPSAVRSPTPSEPAATVQIAQPATTASGAATVPVRVPQAATSVAPSPVAPSPSSDDSASLRAELNLVDRARVDLSDGLPDRALAELEAHRRAFPNGVLSSEAAVLRIEALARSGREEAAAREARAFLARDPGSPHARRVRGFLATMESKDGAR
jgi:hypothetical protein